MAKKKTIDGTIVKAERANAHASWKGGAKAEASVEHARHDMMVDERARVRSTDGSRWAARNKPH